MRFLEQQSSCVSRRKMQMTSLVCLRNNWHATWVCTHEVAMHSVRGEGHRRGIQPHTHTLGWQCTGGHSLLLVLVLVLFAFPHLESCWQIGWVACMHTSSPTSSHYLSIKRCDLFRTGGGGVERPACHLSHALLLLLLLPRRPLLLRFHLSSTLFVNLCEVMW